MEALALSKKAEGMADQSGLESVFAQAS